MADIQELPCAPYLAAMLHQVTSVEPVNIIATNGKVGARGRKDLAGTLAHNSLCRSAARGGICHVQQQG